MKFRVLKSDAVSRRAFTLVELLVVVLVIAILMAVALPMYLSSVADSEIKTCRSNMQMIAGAVQAWRAKNRDSTGLPAMTDLALDLQGQPQCSADPTAGDVDYGITYVGAGPFFQVRCLEVGAHGTFQPGVDSK
jgi:prepilin-type N-terminal cleavage/methylation domain-containing protein